MKEKPKLEKILEERKVTPAQLNAIIDRVQNPEYVLNHAVHHWGEKHTKIGLMGDTHIGSKYSDYAMLRDLYKRFQKAGVDAVYHTGDITEGYGRRKGHSYECTLHGADEQVQGVVEEYPDIKKPTYFIGGDHDGWHFENGGVDVGAAISKERSDMHYLGAFQASIELTKGTNIMLVHPATGTAYAISYKPQKIVESLSGGEKPSILAIGHFHKIEYLFYRNIHTLQTGTTQRQTPWMKRMNLSAHTGGWILDIYTKKDGTPDRVDLKLFPYY